MSALGYKNFADMVIKYTDESNPDEFAQVGFLVKVECITCTRNGD